MTDRGQQGQCEGMRGKSGTGVRCSGFQEREMAEKGELCKIHGRISTRIFTQGKQASKLPVRAKGRKSKTKYIFKKIPSARTTFAARKTMRFWKQK